MAKLHRIIKSLVTQAQLAVEMGKATQAQADSALLTMIHEVALRADILDYQDVSEEEAAATWLAIGSQPSSLMLALAYYVSLPENGGPDQMLDCGHTTGHHAELAQEVVREVNAKLDAAIAGTSTDRVTLSIVKDSVHTPDPSLN